MIKPIFAIAVLCIALFGLHCSQKSVSNPQHVVELEREILLTLLRDKRPNNVVLDSSVGAWGIEDIDRMKKIFPNLADDTFKSFEKRNRDGLPQELLVLTDGFPVVSLEQVKKGEEYPWYYSISRVGVNDSGDQALVLFEDHCPALCGEGAYYLLIKKNNIWQVADKQITWQT